MKSKLLKILLVSSTSVLIFSGCTSTHGGAQTGAATGAIAGSVIAYNTGDSKKHRGERAIVGGLLGAALGAGVGNIADTGQPTQTGGWQQ